MKALDRLRRSPLWIVATYVRHERRMLAAAILWRTAYVVAPMQVPVLTGALVDHLSGHRVSVYGLRPGDDALLAVAIGGLVAVATVHGISGYRRSIARAMLSRNFVSTVRKQVFERVAHLSLDVHQHYGTGELLERTMTDAGSLRRFLERVCIETVANTVRIGYPSVMLFVLAPELAVVALAVLPPQLLITRWLQQRQLRASRRRRTSRSDLTTMVKEGLDGIETVKSLNAEAPMVQRMHKQAERLEEDELTSSRISGAVTGTVQVATGLGIAMTWYLGAQQVEQGAITVGTLVAFAGFVVFVYQPFRQFTLIANTYKQGQVALERIQQLLTTPTSVPDRDAARPLVVRAGGIGFRDVSLDYGGPRVLDGVTVDIPPCTLTSICGRSGSGKTSLLRLIVRLYDPTTGHVLIDGQDLATVTLTSLRSHVGVVPQHSMLFDGTIRENLCLAGDVPDAQLREACEAASVWHFVDGLDDGLDTKLGSEGARTSGGQARRLAIARTLLIEPEILLLDEPTAGLDAEAEEAIVSTLVDLARRRTVVIVDHRPAAVRAADHIVVIDDGRLVDVGSHDELHERSRLYRDLFAAEAMSGS